MTHRRSNDLSFRECALAEATRYGSDPWVFLRELLQNARDAGASRVEFTVTVSGDAESITCRDDGCGMSAGHAERYLFALYASSKEDDERQVGQFGVGFWSVLRFQPRRIVIRSRPRHGPPWQVALERRLEGAAFAPCEMAPGTEIVLERPRSRADLASEVFAAVYRYGRFATRYEKSRWGALKHAERPLTVLVDGRRVHAEMTLPAPSSVFRRPGLRGVVALGAEPRVELFANGLFVRRAASLDDLVDADPRSGPRCGGPRCGGPRCGGPRCGGPRCGGPRCGDGGAALDLPASVAPRILLDSRELEVLLARSDVRQTCHLRRLVRTAERELERLIERQLRAVRPPSAIGVPGARVGALGQRLRAAWRPRGLRRPATAMGMALAVTVLAVTVLGWAALSRPTESGAPWKRGPVEHVTVERYADLGARYPGPRLDPMETRAARPALTYFPADQVLFLSALAIADPAGWPEDVRHEPIAAGDYGGRRCRDGDPCATLRLVTASGPLRLPVPTGHRLDPASVRLNGRPYPVSRTAQDEPLLLRARHGDVVEYRTGPAAAAPGVLPVVPAPRLPATLGAVAQRLRMLPLEARADAAVAAVAARVRYDRTAAAATAYAAARSGGHGLVEAALAVGKGDCDVQNGLVVALLQRSGVVARLAVGYVGRGGTAAPGLHAWVEYVGGDGRWRVADASTRLPPSTAPPSAGSPAAGSPAAGSPAAGSPAAGSPAAGSPVAGSPAAVGSVGLSGSAGASPGLSPPSPAAPGGLVVLVAAVVGLGGWLWYGRTWGGLPGRRMRRAAVVLAETDLAALLGGALRHPGLGRMPALLYGRYVPLIRPGGAVSLHQAKRRGVAGELFATVRRGRLARQAAARGRWVIDAGTPEGRVTALGLGAIDLDAWESLLERSARPPLAGRVNRDLKAAGESWRVAFVTPLDAPAEVVDLARLRLGKRQVLLDPRQIGLAAAALERPSAVAAFRLLDAAAAHLALAPADRARVLAEPARRALLERFGR